MHSIIAMKVCFFFLILASCEKKVLGERCSNALDNPVCDQCRSWCGSTGKDNSELEELIQKKIDAGTKGCFDIDKLDGRSGSSVGKAASYYADGWGSISAKYARLLFECLSAVRRFQLA